MELTQEEKQEIFKKNLALDRKTLNINFKLYEELTRKGVENYLDFYSNYLNELEENTKNVKETKTETLIKIIEVREKIEALKQLLKKGD